MSFIIVLFMLNLSEVHSFDLSLHGNGREGSIVWDRNSGKALCYPSSEMMAYAERRVPHHDWGYHAGWNYTFALLRVGQVLCRQLRFTFIESIGTAKMSTTGGHVMWGASCLGYEVHLDHCVFFTVESDSRCEEVVTLKCANCDKELKMAPGETINLSNPGFPASYTDYIRCQWGISAKTVMSFLITISYQVLPPKDKYGKCRNGYLEILSKTNDSDYFTISSVICGSSKPTTIVIKASVLQLRWVAGSFHPRPTDMPGFELHIKSTSEGSRSDFDSGQMTPPILAILGGLLFAALLVTAVLYWWLDRAERRSRDHRSNPATLENQRDHNQSTPPSQFVSVTSQTPGFFRSGKKDGNKLPKVPFAPDEGASPQKPLSRVSEVSSAIYEDLNLVKQAFQGSYIFLENPPNRNTMSPIDNNRMSPGRLHPESHGIARRRVSVMSSRKRGNCDSSLVRCLSASCTDEEFANKGSTSRAGDENTLKCPGCRTRPYLSISIDHQDEKKNLGAKDSLKVPPFSA